MAAGFSQPQESCSRAVIKQEIEQEVASTTGKVARQFQESQLHLQQELWPVYWEKRGERTTEGRREGAISE